MTETASQESFPIDYSVVRDGGAGLIDLSARGRLLVSGSEAVMFLNGLITNDVKTLAVNNWMPAAFANVQGRLLASVRIIHREDGFLIDTEDATHDKVLKILDRFTLAGDFRLTDLSGETAVISVQGARAAGLINATVGDEASILGRQKVQRNYDQEITVIRATHTGEDGFDLFVKASDASRLRDRLMSAGAKTVSESLAETLRIEAGIPRYGVDMDETTVVTEANLDDAISFTKGCYLGQEIIVRIKHRGHVAKKLTGMILEERAPVEPNAKVLSADEKEIGRVTSSTFSPRLDRTIALGYVKYDYLAPGTKVMVVSAEKRLTASVIELPFVRGSWYQD